MKIYSWLHNVVTLQSMTPKVIFKVKTMSYMLFIVSVSVWHQIIIVKRKHIQQIVIFIDILVTTPL